jgi:hypothetical protein
MKTSKKTGGIGRLVQAYIRGFGHRGDFKASGVDTD